MELHTPEEHGYYVPQDSSSRDMQKLDQLQLNCFIALVPITLQAIEIDPSFPASCLKPPTRPKGCHLLLFLISSINILKHQLQTRLGT